MCGLVGVAGDLAFIDEGLIKRLLILDYFRGTDSTGIAAVKISKEVSVLKIASHPINLFDMKSFAKDVNGFTCSAFIGHNRAATLGKVNDLNAHPFKYGDIVGAHNGTLTTDSWKALEEASGVETTVDSAAIFACIDAIGIEDTIKLMEKGRTSKDGAWALVWYDAKDNTINFLRNEHRPLWMAYSKGFKKLLWASEWPMIQAATKLSATEYEVEVDANGYGYWEVPEDTWLKWDLDELMKGSKNKPKPVAKKLKGKEPKPVVSYSGGAAPFMQQGHVSGTTSSVTTMTGSTKNTPLFIELAATVVSPMAGVVEKADFDYLTKRGCSWCSSHVDYDDKQLLVNLEHDYVLCKKCNNLGINETRVYVNHTTYAEMLEKRAA